MKVVNDVVIFVYNAISASVSYDIFLPPTLTSSDRFSVYILLPPDIVGEALKALCFGVVRRVRPFVRSFVWTDLVTTKSHEQLEPSR